MKGTLGLIGAGALTLVAACGRAEESTETRRRIADVPAVDAAGDDAGARPSAQDDPDAPSKTSTPGETPVLGEPEPESSVPTVSAVAEPAGAPAQVPEPSLAASPLPTAPIDAGPGDTNPGFTKPASPDGPPADEVDRCSADAGLVGVITADEFHDYSFDSELSFRSVAVTPSSELHFDWSDLAHDLRGRQLDATTDIDMVSLMLWRAPAETLAEKVHRDALSQSDLVMIAMIYPDQTTSGSSFDMTSFGMPLDPDLILSYFDDAEYPGEQHTYTVMASTGTIAGQNTRMLQAFHLDPASTNTNVVMNDESTGLDYAVKIHGDRPVVVPAGVADLEIDWSNITTTALGTEFFPEDITRVVVAKYSMNVAEMEANFLDLDDRADELYRADVPNGTRSTFETLVADDGTPFSGIDSGGTWVVALFCGSCLNPAPWYLSVLAACPTR